MSAREEEWPISSFLSETSFTGILIRCFTSSFFMADEFVEENIPVKGMSCKKCVEKIESKLSSVDGIKRASVNLAEDNVSVSFNPEKISITKIKSLIKELGYSVNDIQKKNSLLEGLFYGLIPHIGCVGFIFASVIGSTVLLNLFKPLLMNRYIFYILILFSFIFAGISSVVYLNKNGLLSFKGAKKKWKYLSVMFGSTAGVNVLLFFFIFPLLANVSFANVTGSVIGADAIESVTLTADIPCPGHAPLISNELKSISGVSGVKYSLPNVFEVLYDSSKTSLSQILSLKVFESYPATPELSVNSVSDSVKESYSGGCGCGVN